MKCHSKRLESRGEACRVGSGVEASSAASLTGGWGGISGVGEGERKVGRGERLTYALYGGGFGVELAVGGHCGWDL